MQASGCSGYKMKLCFLGGALCLCLGGRVQVVLWQMGRARSPRCASGFQVRPA